MELTAQQIERYARQIVTPGVGGRAQKRLLTARLLLIGAAADIAPVLAYMAGAGVGEIRLHLPMAEAAQLMALAAATQDLNPEVFIAATEPSAPRDLVLAIAADSTAADSIQWPLTAAEAPLIVVHPDEPASIALFTACPPCPRCADATLLEHFNGRGRNAGFVTMIAAVEAFKLLAHIAPPGLSRLFQFNQFEYAVRELRQKRPHTDCVPAWQRSGHG